MDTTDIIRRRWRYALIGILCMLFFGASYAWGVFVVPLEKEYGFLRTETSLAFTLNILFFACGLFITGWLAGKWSFAKILRLGAALLGAGFALAALASSMAAIYFSFSLLCGTGSGICYNAVVSSVPQWFPDRPGFVTGLLLVGYALSTALFGPLSHFLMASYGVASTFFIIGAACFVFLLVLSFGLETPDTAHKAALPAPITTKAPLADQSSVPPREMLRKGTFWLAFFSLGFISGSGLIVINHIAPMLTEELAVAPTTASLVISAIFLCNALGRIGSGWLMDCMGFGITFALIAGSMLAAMAILLAALYAASPFAAIFASGLALFAFGSNASMIPNSVRFLFGQKFFPINFSLMNTNILLVSLMPTLAGFLQVHHEGYAMLFVYLTGLEIFTLILIALLIWKRAR